MAKEVPVHEYLARMERSRPGLLLRLLARLMVRCGLGAGWAHRVHIRDVEYRAIRNIVKDSTNGTVFIVTEPGEEIELASGVGLGRGRTDEP
jgi:hypothetical protein